ncbi:MAG: HlyD family secretion protein, partial [Desulfovibrionaceae bacterium]|nr:HlyD family secretion protein [Desulfovibrionaceae bacterium]
SRDQDNRYQVTDDAYTCADSTKVSPQISGRVTAVLVKENQPVRAGDLMLTIDDREYALQVANAEALLESAKAAHASLHEKTVQQQSLITQAEADVDADRASLELARQEYDRYRKMAADGSGSRQRYQQATSALKVAQANLERDTAKHQAELGQMTILKADLRQAAALIEQAEAALDLARLNLSYCRVAAPIDGVISQNSVRLGAYVRTGDALFAVVPLQDIYITAYYRETQLANIKAGQPVTFTVDAFPDKTFTGSVLSLGPASNASFSSVAPHSTSSNFTKIVQRLPVRIAVTDKDANLLKVGMSVIPSVDTEAK